jgi:hypothetical protein
MGREREGVTIRQGDDYGVSDRATVEAVRSAIASLTSRDLLRLERIAASRLRALGAPDAMLAPADLLYESIRRVLEQRRVWRPGRVGFVQLLVGVMWSVSSGWRARRPAALQAVRLGEMNEREAVDLGVRDTSPSQEEVLVRRQREAAIRQAFANDPVATQVLAAMLDGATFRDIREQHGIDDHALQAALKRIRRRLNLLKRPPGAAGTSDQDDPKQ